jgi:hypothetical protein
LFIITHKDFTNEKKKSLGLKTNIDIYKQFCYYTAIHLKQKSPRTWF